MPKKEFIKKVLVIGSGPIIIGQAAEFDYAGTQACRALKQEGIEVVLVNSNPATIMTDENMADQVYIEPLTVEFLKKVILREKPDSILPTLGGQVGLNLAMELAESGFLDEINVKLLGTKVESIKKAEDREAFKQTMEEIGEPVIESVIVTNVEDAIEFADREGYPLIVRPAYTLGGTGGGIVDNKEELIRVATDGLRLSRVNQVLIEKCVSGWKEIEYEAVRDCKGNCITVCNMENIDPVGIHTGDSIVVAPSQTLSDKEHQMLRSASINIISSLEIEGGCNVQFALDTVSMKYYVIEVNPRLSRSSALASKATGYPIAKVATKIALGFGMDEIINEVTGKTYACFEPTLDYVVIKIPKWPFDKFVKAIKKLGTQMKATGEVMSISSSFEAALLKAVRSLEINLYSLEDPELKNLDNKEILNRLGHADDRRLFLIAEALRRGVAEEDISVKTGGVDIFFIDKIKNIVDMENRIKEAGCDGLNPELLREAKRIGLPDVSIAEWVGKDYMYIKNLRDEMSIKPVYKLVDTCAAEFDAVSPYYYSVYDLENEVQISDKKKVVVLGSGPIRIGQGIEFDYCSVHAVWALKEKGYETIIINNNPETVSTDFDTSDKLYFEPLTIEDVDEILQLEKPDGVIVQFGGQTAIKLTNMLDELGYNIMGTQPENINRAEDRKEFDELLTRLDIKRPLGKTVFTEKEAVSVAQELGYPVLVRPSYVLGGQGMEIAYDDNDVLEFMKIINMVKQEHPILIDKYITGKEIEVDAICDGEDILIPGIMEHIERAGIHSGDSISVYPAQKVSQTVQEKIVEYTMSIAKSLEVSGLINIQYIVSNEEVYIIEVNPRSSRTVPYLSKVTGIPMIQLATRCILGEKLKDMEYGTGLLPETGYIAVKIPVFSFEKLPNVETSLGPEMKSTGEVLGISKNFHEALYKGLIAAGMNIKREGNVLLTVANKDKQDAITVGQGFYDLGFKLWGTSGTAHVLNKNYIPTNVVTKLKDGDSEITALIAKRELDYIINTPTKGRVPLRDGFKIRRLAVEQNIPCFTSIDTAMALLNSLEEFSDKQEPSIIKLGDLK